MGTIVFALTIPWAATLIVGRCDINNGEMKENSLSGEEKILTKTGITVDNDTRYLSAALFLSVGCYFILETAIFFSKNDDLDSMAKFQKPFLLISSILSAVLFIAFIVWSFVRRRHVMLRRVKEAHRQQAVHHVIDQFKNKLTLSRQTTFANTNIDFPRGWEVLFSIHFY